MEEKSKKRYRHRSRKSSLSRDYFFFAVMLAVTILLIAGGMNVFIYLFHQEHKTNRLKEDALRVERVISGEFEYNERLAGLLGRQIAERGADDLEFISELFRRTTLPEMDPDNIFSWSLFDWVNHNGLQVVNTRLGVVRNPKDMSMRSYTRKAPLHPWMLQVSKPAIGYPSGQWVIPVGVGVVDKKGKYLGIIAAGINVAKLTEKIERVLQDDVSFVVVGEDTGDDPAIITHSSNIHMDVKQLNALFNAGLYKKDHQEVRLGNTVFFARIAMQKYPYHIWMGYRKDVVIQDYISVIFPRMLELLGMGVFCFMLLWFFRQKIIAPITHLSNAADKVSQGSTEIFIPRCDTYELDNLARQLQQVVRYIRELQQIRQELIKKTEAAESANRAKSEFLACMSHELRTPLNAVIAFSEILKEEMFGYLGNEKYLEYARDIYNSGTHLLSIINEILDISKAEAGMIVLQKHPADVKRVIAECLSIVSERAAKGGIRLEANLPADLPQLVSDELRLKQIIINLLSNAVKFTPEGGKVTISAWPEITGNKVVNYYISVRDTGIGMKEEDIPKAIEKFGQLDTGLNRKFEGTGLGLPLTKKLVEIHQGELWIESKLNKGTVVTVRFPQNTEIFKEQAVLV